MREEQKNYLEEELTGQEKNYLKKIVVSVRNRYIEQNNKNIEFGIVPIEETERIVVDSNDIVDIVSEQYDEDINTPDELPKLFTRNDMYKKFKALSLIEKNVLFCLYKNKTINEIAGELGIYRGTVRVIRDKAKNKLEGKE